LKKGNVGRFNRGWRIDGESGAGHTAKNEVLQAIGMPVGFDPDINTCRLKPGERSMRQFGTQLVD